MFRTRINHWVSAVALSPSGLHYKIYSPMNTHGTTTSTVISDHCQRQNLLLVICLHCIHEEGGVTLHTTNR